MIKAQGYQSDTTDLIGRHSELVQKIAYHLMARLPANVLVDDLVQSGMIGLLEAARNFDATKGASFETFAGIRIRGAMLDDLRKGDWVPRSVHKNSRTIATAIDEVEKQTGESATEVEVAKHLQVTLSEYQKMLQDVNCAKLVAYEDLPNPNDMFAQSSATADSTFDDVAENQFTQQLAEMIEALPQREALVLSLYYDEELNLKEIGLILEVSESRVSQILSQALHKLKSKVNSANI
ncbi:RNA polymerase sigma factor FliA [Psychromonas sp. B3M02]|uniref:RNA polymerase sigma factor FliA n=1 Tax=unclassified Psychromonas TaxID=2614957 RepID=UPI000DEB834E|nr:RNA polymerase sigma factor FliA [Psychromonas sp. B3M02]RBW47764.1 RNA polymerase sigma factor FliA [Psychromonas sp. B3M02]